MCVRQPGGLSRFAVVRCPVGVGKPERDADVGEELVVGAYPALRRFAYVVADADTDPDDLLHEALVRTLARGPLSEIDDLGAYVRRAITNTAANTRRSLGRRRRALDRLGAVASEDEAVEPSRPSDLGDLMLLAPADRAALYLSVVEGRPHREVAALLDVSEVAARARVSRALQRLRVKRAEDLESTAEVPRGDR